MLRAFGLGIVIALLPASAVFAVPSCTGVPWAVLSNGSVANADQVMGNFDCLAPLVSPNLIGNVSIGNPSGDARLIFSNTDASSNNGIYWFTPSPDYGIYKTVGGWNSPDYQQLVTKFITGIVIDGGSAYPKSGTILQPNGGNVGIGTASPSARLHVLGGGGAAEILQTTNANSYVGLRFYNDQNNLNRALALDYAGSTYASPLITGGPTGESASITTTGAYPLVLGTNNTARMTLTSAGTIGVGTTSPNAALTVSSSGPNGLNLSVDTGASVNSGRVFFSNATAGQAYALYNSGGALLFASGGTVGSTSGTTRVAINQSGYVGIGTTSPAANLEVYNPSANGISLAGAANGSAPSISSVGTSDSNVGLLLRSKGAGEIEFRVNTVPQLKVGSFASASSFLVVKGGNASSSVSAEVVGSDPNASLWLASKGTGSIFFGSSGQIQARVQSAASGATNYLMLQASNTGGPAILTANGTDSNIGIRVKSVGSGSIDLQTSARQAMVLDTASAVDYLTFTGGASSSNAVTIGSAGSDTNVSILLSPAGTGNVGIGKSSPSQKLEVNGNVLVQNGNGLSARNAAGTAMNLIKMETYDDLTVGGSNVINMGFYTGGLERMRVSAGGNVGIGTGAATPVKKLTVVGDVRIGTSGTNGCVENFAGTALTGTCSSDAALKTITGSVTGVLVGFAKLQLVHFHWNDVAEKVYRNSKQATNTGFIAQEVQKQFPELVTRDEKGYRKLDYTTLSLYGLEAIRELKDVNDKLATEIRALKEASRRQEKENELLRAKQVIAFKALQDQVAAMERKLTTKTAQN